LGGSILTFGGKPDGSSWKVGIVNPFDTSSNVGILSLEGQWCVSTSGDYERYVEADGVRYHHLIDPETLYPGRRWRAVTVLHPSSAVADALSTALFLTEPQEALEFVRTIPNARAVLTTLDGEILDSAGLLGPDRLE